MGGIVNKVYCNDDEDDYSSVDNDDDDDEDDDSDDGGDGGALVRIAIKWHQKCKLAFEETH